MELPLVIALGIILSKPLPDIVIDSEAFIVISPLTPPPSLLPPPVMAIPLFDAICPPS
ncbi:MAG: hypothetical protein QNJ32_01155 [Xenococcaceae cyanobacterium MO_167.B27]|nr:hypothetical protein [Xenococcaceae cyanobacterium MO_167.B27]